MIQLQGEILVDIKKCHFVLLTQGKTFLRDTQAAILNLKWRPYQRVVKIYSNVRSLELLQKTQK